MRGGDHGGFAVGGRRLGNHQLRWLCARCAGQAHRKRVRSRRIVLVGRTGMDVAGEEGRAGEAARGSARSPRRHGRQGEASFLVTLAAVLALAVLISWPQVCDEVRFFATGSLVDARGGQPVPQDDAVTPALDASLVRAAALLPRTAICAVATGAWNRTYFRASYLLMPRRVWPVGPGFADGPLSAAQIAATMAAHRANCLLAAAGVPKPVAMRRLAASGGGLALYVECRCGVDNAPAAARGQPGLRRSLAREQRR